MKSNERCPPRLVTFLWLPAHWILVGISQNFKRNGCFEPQRVCWGRLWIVTPQLPCEGVRTLRLPSQSGLCWQVDLADSVLCASILCIAEFCIFSGLTHNEIVTPSPTPLGQPTMSPDIATHPLGGMGRNGPCSEPLTQSKGARGILLTKTPPTPNHSCIIINSAGSSLLEHIVKDGIKLFIRIVIYKNCNL